MSHNIDTIKNVAKYVLCMNN